MLPGHAGRPRLGRSDKASLVLQLTSLVDHDSRPGDQELAFVQPVVVGAEQQLVVPAIRDEDTDQHVGSDAAPIAPIGSCKSDCCHRCHDASLLLVLLVGVRKRFYCASCCLCHCQPWLVEASIGRWSYDSLKAPAVRCKASESIARGAGHLAWSSQMEEGSASLPRRLAGPVMPFG